MAGAALDATDVTVPVAAAATTAAAAIPVMRDFWITVVLSIGPAHQEVNKRCWCVEFLDRTQSLNRR
jgi:hypothetical protein